MINAPEIESALLGKSIENEEACTLVLSQLEPEDFTGHRALIFEAIQGMFGKNAPVSPATVRNYLQEHGLEEEVGGRGCVEALLQDGRGVKDEGVDVACHYLKRYSKARKFKELLRKFNQEANEYGAESDRLFAKAGTEFFDLLADKADQNESNLREVLDEEIQRLNEPIEGGIMSGLDMDKITKGFRPGNLVVIAGKTSHGKSALVHNLVLTASREIPSAIVSMEMTRSEIIERFFSNQCNIKYQHIRERTLSETEYTTIQAHKSELRQHKITIIDKGTMDIDHLYATTRRLKLQQNIGLLVVDYLQQVASDGETREREVAKVTRRLKSIAQDLDIVVIGLSQFNRKASDHERPQMNHLRESGAIEQDANTVILLWNPGVDGKEYFSESDTEGRWAGKSTKNVVEVNVAKNRGGYTGVVKIGFDGDFQRFYNLAPEPEHKTAMDYLDTTR